MFKGHDIAWGWMSGVRFWSLDRRPVEEIDEDLNDEFMFHIEQRARDLIDEGMSNERANRVAIEQFGNLNRIKHQCKRIALQERIMQRKIHMVVTGLLVVALIVTTFVAMKMYQQARAHQDQAMAQLQVAEQSRRATEQERARAEAVSRFLEEMLATTDPSREPLLTVAEVLDAAAKRAEIEFADDPDLLATLRQTIEKSRATLSQPEPSATKPNSDSP